MRLLFVTYVILILCGSLLGQDGSNMRYVKPTEINESFVGRRMHLDFGQKYVRSIGQINSDRWETVLIGVGERKLKFIEHRVDDGYNNWFHQQYLESVDEIEGLKLRITEFELLKIDEKDISLKAFLAYFDKAGKIKPDKSFVRELSFKKKEIAEFLVKIE